MVDGLAISSEVTPLAVTASGEAAKRAAALEEVLKTGAVSVGQAAVEAAIWREAKWQPRAAEEMQVRLSLRQTLAGAELDLGVEVRDLAVLAEQDSADLAGLGAQAEGLLREMRQAIKVPGHCSNRRWLRFPICAVDRSW